MEVLRADPALVYPHNLSFADERGEGDGEGFNLNLPLPLGELTAIVLESFQGA